MIRPYSTILSVDIEAGAVESGDQETIGDAGQDKLTFLIIFQNMLTRAIFEKTYDCIICATGYQRSSWISLLKSSNLGKHFGLHSASSEVHLTPATEQDGREYNVDGAHRTFDIIRDISSTERSSEISSPSSGSTLSTPSTSPGPSTFSSTRLDHDIQPHSDELRISRSYRLLPVPSEGGAEGERDMFKPRIYVQGVEEETHGLSDTLLSVLGVRAGEVVTDLCKREGD